MTATRDREREDEKQKKNKGLKKLENLKTALTRIKNEQADAELKAEEEEIQRKKE